jgi:hypothetical protein
VVIGLCPGGHEQTGLSPHRTRAQDVHGLHRSARHLPDAFDEGDQEQGVPAHVEKVDVVPYLVKAEHFTPQGPHKIQPAWLIVNLALTGRCYEGRF